MAKGSEESEAQVLNKLEKVRLFGRVDSRSMEIKWRKANGVLEKAEIRAVHETTFRFRIALKMRSE